VEETKKGRGGRKIEIGWSCRVAGVEGDKGARGEGAEGVVTRGNFAAGGGKDGRHSGGLPSRNRAALEEEEKGNFLRTCL
jgi:hypothetical protein